MLSSAYHPAQTQAMQCVSWGYLLTGRLRFPVVSVEDDLSCKSCHSPYIFQETWIFNSCHSEQRKHTQEFKKFFVYFHRKDLYKFYFLPFSVPQTLPRCAASADPDAISRYTKKIRAFTVPWLPWESQNSVNTVCKSENHSNSMIRMINWHCQRDDRFLISPGNKCTYSMFSRLIWCILQINFYC